MLQRPCKALEKRNEMWEKKKGECCICLDMLDIDEDSIYWPCINCPTAWCLPCLRDAFISAIADESLMPCRCCYNLPLSRVRDLLTPHEIALYKAKLEERNDHRRLYCPVPTCSTYISRKLYGHLVETWRPQEEGLEIEGAGKAAETTGLSSDTKTVKQGPTTLCPECTVKICLSCKQLSHPGETCKEDPFRIDEVTNALGGRAVKRCPKCHMVTERVKGCPLIECRCGAQWCWICGRPGFECEDDICEGDVGDSGEESGTQTPSSVGQHPNEYHWNKEAYEYDGEEAPPLVDQNSPLEMATRAPLPHPGRFNDPFTCYHQWHSLDPTPDSDPFKRINVEIGEEFECERCGRAIFSNTLLRSSVNTSLLVCCDGCGTMACPECSVALSTVEKER